ncbi:MAG: hypothetical protein M1368_12735 [Thaumarchaeota archaeon]|nr:hypothetical protein [Nitrososphaerota archaeon]
MSEDAMIGGKRIPIMVRIHGPMKIDANACGNVECGLHEGDGEILGLGQRYYDATFSIAEDEWIGTSFFICEDCMPKFLAESEATKREITSEKIET